MGNRAVITDKKRTTALYLHWNGGRDSVEAFVRYCELKQYRAPGQDTSYAFARLAQVVGNYFGGALSVGVLPYTDDEGMLSLGDDNGVYVLDGWSIAERVYPTWHQFSEQDSYPLEEMLRDIDGAQPTREQLGDFLSARPVSADDITIGDLVWVWGYRDSTPRLHRVLGFGDGRVLNWRNTAGIPYVDLFEDDPADPAYDPADNPNNYLTGEIYKA